MTVEAVLLAGVAAGWLTTDARPEPTTAPLLLGLAPAAMGVQSAVTISSGVPGASTTYLSRWTAGYLPRSRGGTALVMGGAPASRPVGLRPLRHRLPVR